MKQNVLVISTSLGKSSNSEIPVKEFEKGAKAAGNTVEFISLANKQIGFCIGCLRCLKNKKCFMKDDAAKLLKKYNMPMLLHLQHQFITMKCADK